jgi:CheY-like chemotaxis protein
LVISDYLLSCGYSVIEAADAVEALTVLRHAGIQIDVVFSDVEMLGPMDGFGLAKWVRANRHGLNVILAGRVSGSAGATEKLCEATHLPKPYESQALVGGMGAMPKCASGVAP